MKTTIARLVSEVAEGLTVIVSSTQTSPMRAAYFTVHVSGGVLSNGEDESSFYSVAEAMEFAAAELVESIDEAHRNAAV